MIYYISYYLPIGLLVLNCVLLLRKTELKYTKILVSIANFWLIMFLINNYFELRAFFFSKTQIATDSIFSNLSNNFLLISIITLAYNVVVELLLKF